MLSAGACVFPCIESGFDTDNSLVTTGTAPDVTPVSSDSTESVSGGTGRESAAAPDRPAGACCWADATTRGVGSRYVSFFNRTFRTIHGSGGRCKENRPYPYCQQKSSHAVLCFRLYSRSEKERSNPRIYVQYRGYENSTSREFQYRISPETGPARPSAI